MDRRQLLKILGMGAMAGLYPGPLAFANHRRTAHTDNSLSKKAYSAYLMAYFKAEQQQLFYAVSQDARNWTPLNGDQPVLATTVNLRDPFIGRADGQFHLVHTKGWDFPVIYHYTSNDLLDWEGGPIQVVPEIRKRAWAPEWYYAESEGIFYVFWASEYNGHNTLFYTKTKDWKDIRPEHSKVYYDLGMDDIDFTVTKIGTGYIGFHKPGSLKDNFSVQCMYSPTLNPEDADFGFGNNKYPAPDLPEVIKPIEGPEIIRLNQEDKWYIYADPFHQSFIAWETTDFKHFERIPVHVPKGSKHCSMLGITEAELNQLKRRYPI